MAKNIIDILNNDPKVKNFMTIARDAAIRQGVTAEEWQKAKKDLLMLSIAICPEAREKLAEEVYNKINGI